MVLGALRTFVCTRDRHVDDVIMCLFPALPCPPYMEFTDPPLLKPPKICIWHDE